jgi:hypothetical protein
MSEPAYILFEDDTVIGPFEEADEKLYGTRESLIERYVIDQGWDDLAYNVVPEEALPEGIQILAPKTQAVTVNLRLIGISRGEDPREVLAHLFDNLGEDSLTTIYLAER